MGRRPLCLLAALVTAGTLVAFASATTWQRYRGPGFAISVPPRWLIMPASDAQARALVVRLRAQGKPALANAVQAYMNDKYQRTRGRVFDAVETPALESPIATDVLVKRDALPADIPATTASLRGIAAGAFATVKKERGLRTPQRSATRVALEGGTSYLIYGSSATVGFGGARTGFAIYMLINKRGIWSIEFRTDSHYFNLHATLFRKIAGTFRFR
jgi:hypothetical protein